MPNPYEKRASARRQALMSLLTGAVAEPAAGIAGLYGLMTGGVDKGVRNIEQTRNALTYQPRDPSALQALGRAVEPVMSRYEGLKSSMGDQVMNRTGSAGLSTAAYMVPDTLMSLLGARGMGAKGPPLAQMVERSRGPTMGGTRAQDGMIGWHGTPHTFPPTANNPLGEFDAGKVGTGEGAQAYGHGAAYIAGEREVGRRYQQSLSTTAKVSPEAGAAFDQAYPSGEAVIDRIHWTRPDSLVRAYKDGYVKRSEIPPHLADAFDKEASSGNLYQVDIPDEAIAKFLDWDKPLSEQPEHVQQAWQHYIASPEGIEADSSMRGALSRGEGQYANPSGQDFYGSIFEAMPGMGVPARAAVTERLKGYGIPGIRYLDGNNRTPTATQTLHRDYLKKADGDVERAADMLIKGQWESRKNRASLIEQIRNSGPMSNYVVFDGKNAKIIGRE